MEPSKIECAKCNHGNGLDLSLLEDHWLFATVNLRDFKFTTAMYLRFHPRHDPSSGAISASVQTDTLSDKVIKCTS